MQADVAIVGGGVVGSLTACLLQRLGYHVQVLEAFSAIVDDQRTVALSLSSQRILVALKLWEVLKPHAQPIQQIHVSDRGRFGFTRMDAKQQKVPALGYVISLYQLQQALQAQLTDAVTWLAPAVATHVETLPDTARLVFTHHQGKTQQLDAKLVLAADGANSVLAQQLGIQTQTTDYEQVGLVANIELAQDHQSIAYERFTASGPLAMLPIAPKQMSLVWSLKPTESEAMLALNDADFLAALQEAFGYRAGRLVGVGKRAIFPLKLTVPERLTEGRVLLFGNAAHGLHPIAGQGLNLSMRDIAGLAELLKEQEDPGAECVLQRYVAERQQDQRVTIQLTDQLVKGFSMTLGPVALLRDLGLVLTDRTPWLNRILAKRMMGTTAARSRLMRGLPL